MNPWYLAGRMTGIPQFNFPRFAEAAQILRDAGFSLVVPSEEDTDAVKEAALASPDGLLDDQEKIGGRTWGEILGDDVRIVADDVHGVIALDDWWFSRGARLECYVALLCDKPVAHFINNKITYPARSEVLRLIQENT